MTLNILSCCCRCQTQQLNRKALSRSEPEVEAEVSASYFPKMSNLLSLRASYVYLWDCNTRMSVDFLQVCNRRYRLVRDLSKEINHPPLCSFSKHMQGVHLNSFKWVSKIFQKTNVFLFFVSFFFLSETVIPVDIVPPRLKLPLKIICFMTGTVVPNGVNVQFDECFVDCRSLVVACGLVRHQFP